MKNIEGWTYMLLGALLNGGASILLKYAAMQEVSMLSERNKASIMFLLLAVTCYIGAFGLYYFALKRVEVGVAYLVMTAIAAIVVNMYGHFMFGNVFGFQNWLGAALITLGLILMIQVKPL